MRYAIPWSTRLSGALLLLAVATVHVVDQGGLMAFTDPDWLGWSYRIIEVSALVAHIVTDTAMPLVSYLQRVFAAGGFPQWSGESQQWVVTRGAHAGSQTDLTKAHAPYPVEDFWRIHLHSTDLDCTQGQSMAPGRAA